MNKKAKIAIGVLSCLLLAAVITLIVLVGYRSGGNKTHHTSSQSHHTHRSTQTKQGSKITKDKAGQIATDKYGGKVINIEADTHDGSPAWEVEIRDSKQGRIEVDVDQTSGKIVEMEKD